MSRKRSCNRTASPMLPRQRHPRRRAVHAQTNEADGIVAVGFAFDLDAAWRNAQAGLPVKAEHDDAVLIGHHVAERDVLSVGVQERRLTLERIRAIETLQCK